MTDPKIAVLRTSSRIYCRTDPRLFEQAWIKDRGWIAEVDLQFE